MPILIAISYIFIGMRATFLLCRRLRNHFTETDRNRLKLILPSFVMIYIMGAISFCTYAWAFHGGPLLDDAIILIVVFCMVFAPIVLLVMYFSAPEGDSNAMETNKSNSNVSNGTILFSLFAVISLIIVLGVCSSNTTEQSDEDKAICRRSGCGRTAIYSDWDRRFCSEHITETSYCRYPGCTAQIPNSSKTNYCSKHD